MPSDTWGLEIDKISVWFGKPFTLEDIQCPQNDEIRRNAPPPGNKNISQKFDSLDFTALHSIEKKCFTW